MSRYQLHPTGVAEFERCPERFRRKYIENQREPKSIPLIIGSALDAMVTADMHSKIRSGKLLPEDSTEDIVRDVIYDHFTGDVDVKRSELLKVKSETTARALQVAAYAHRIFCNSIPHPKSVQRPWSVRLDKLFKKHDVSMEVDYVGTMDVEAWQFDFAGLLENPPKPCGTSIHDLKIPRKAPSADAASTQYWTQLTSYALGKNVEDKEMPQFVQIDAIVDGKSRIAHRIARATRNKFDFAALYNRLITMGRSLQAGIFPPASKGHWICTEKFCRYHSTCPYVRNKVTVDLHVPDPNQNRLFDILPAR